MTTKDTSSNADTVHLPKSDYEKAKVIVEQIAFHADLTTGTLRSALPHLESEENSSACLLCATALEMLGKIGWLADLATGKLNGTDAPDYKDAESWLLPPSYKWVDEKQEVQS